jgi:hypothetical protein
LLGSHRGDVELLADRLCEHHYADTAMLREWLGDRLPSVT